MSEVKPQVILQNSLSGASWVQETTLATSEVVHRYTDYFYQQYDMPQTIAQFLAMRGVTPETIDSFLEPRLRDILPNPSIFKDMDKACLLLAEAIIQKKPIGS